MNFPAIFTSTEPAGLKLKVGDIPIEPVAVYPVLLNATATVSRKGAGVAKLEFSLARDEFGRIPVIDDGYFTRWQPIQLIASFGLVTEDILHGYIVKLTPEFPEERGNAKVTIEIQDQSIAMDRETVNKSWNAQDTSEPLSDGAVLRAILGRYAGLRGALGNGEGTKTKPLVQGKTDFAFLSERADQLGCEFRVIAGEVFFGPINLDQSLQKTVLIYAGQYSHAREFRIDEEAGTATLAQMTTADANADSGTHQSVLRPNLRRLGGQFAFEEGGSGLPEYRWVLQADGNMNPSDAALFAQARVNEASLSIKAECVIDSTRYGEVVEPGRTIKIDGVSDCYSGEYYVDEVEHIFEPAGYIQKLHLMRNAVGEAL